MSSISILLLLCLLFTSGGNLVLPSPRHKKLESDIKNFDLEHNIQSGPVQQEYSVNFERNFHFEDTHKEVGDDAKSKKISKRQINVPSISETLVKKIQKEESTSSELNEVAVIIEALADQKGPVKKVRSVHIQAVSLEPLIDKGGVVEKVLSVKEGRAEKVEPVKKVGPASQRRKSNKESAFLKRSILENASSMEKTKTIVKEGEVNKEGLAEEVIPINIKDNVKSDFVAPKRGIELVYKAELSNEVEAGSSEPLVNNEITLESYDKDKSIEKRNKIEQVLNVVAPSKHKNNKSSVKNRTVQLVNPVLAVESASKIKLVNKVKQVDIFKPTRRKTNKDLSLLKTSSVTNELFQFANDLLAEIKKDFNLIAHHESYNSVWNRYIYSLVGHFFLQCTINLSSEQSGANLTTWYDDAFDLALRKVKVRRNSTATQFAAPLRRAIGIFKRAIALPIQIIQTNCRAKMNPRDCKVVFFEKLLDASKGCENVWNHYEILEKAVEIQQRNSKSVAPSKNRFIIKSKKFESDEEVFDVILEDLNDKRENLREAFVEYTDLYKLIQHYQEFGMLGCLSLSSPRQL